MMQGGWMNKDPYAQLPGFGESEIKKVNAIMNKKTICKYAEYTTE